MFCRSANNKSCEVQCYELKSSEFISNTLIAAVIFADRKIMFGVQCYPMRRGNFEHPKNKKIINIVGLMAPVSLTTDSARHFVAPNFMNSLPPPKACLFCGKICVNVKSVQSYPGLRYQYVFSPV